MRKREFPASHPLLGLLSLGPATGYDLRKRAEATLAAFWHEGFAQVYESLDYFETQGLASPEASPHPRRKKVFTITDLGQQTFQRWLEQPVETHQWGRHELLVKLFFGRRLAPEVLCGHLRQYGELQRRWRGSLEALAEQLRATEALDPDLPYWLATVSHGVALGRALEVWVQQTRNELTPGCPDSLSPFVEEAYDE